MAYAIEDLIASDNIATMLSKEELEKLGRDVVHNFEIDKRSRYDWEKKTEEALKLALQVMEAKSFPWPNASNVKFPLITIAALQYHARSYPVLISGPKVVKCKVTGDDPTGALTPRAERVENHMSYQILEEDENWEDQMDKVLITQPIIGCAFKKTYYDSHKGHNVSENILAKDLVVSYYTKSFETAPRISHVIYLSKNDVHERVTEGLYLDEDLLNEVVPEQDTLQLAQNKAQGVSQPQEDPSLPYEFIEQHCFIDLDEDGYEEPYIAVVHKKTKKVVRVVARFFSSGIEYKDGNILRIKAEQYFTKYPFIPSPDGGFYDLGFGSLLGPLNESINTLINQLVDAGTMSNTAGGFLSRGIKLRGGTLAFQPNEWKPVDSTGDDLHKGIMPLPVREPSQVLFTLLSLLIDYGERVGGAVDILVGQNPGQNTPAETSRNMTEQGMKIFSGIFKRTHRSLKEEFRKLYRLNQLYFDKIDMGGTKVTSKDYEGDFRDIVPAADPNMVSDSQKVMQATQVLQMATPMWGYNMYEVHKHALKAMKVSDVDVLLPDPKGPNAMPPFKPPQVLIEEMKAQGMAQREQIKSQVISEKTKATLQVSIIEMQQDALLNQAKIDQLQADALLKLQQADSEDSKLAIAAIDAQIGAAKSQQEHLLKTIQLMHQITQDKKQENSSE